MASSLTQGIEAAKLGQMEQALAHLKDAIIEEPNNADVWVWLAAIIEDEDKQTIFLKKALEIDPNNKPAQRGLAFIERKKYIPPKPGEKLSDYTKPIGVFKATPAQFTPEISITAAEPEAPAAETADSAPGTTTESDEAEVIPIAEAPVSDSSTAVPQTTTPAIKPSTPKRKAWVDIVIYGVILIAFVVIGILVGTTLLNVNIPFLSRPTPVLTVLPSNEGVFILENGQYTEMKLNLNKPESNDGVPLISQKKPQIVINTQVINLQRLQFVDQDGNSIAFTTIPAEANTQIITPQEDLQSGQYCLVFTLNADRGEALYWCLQVK